MSRIATSCSWQLARGVVTEFTCDSASLKHWLSRMYAWCLNFRSSTNRTVVAITHLFVAGKHKWVICDQYGSQRDGHWPYVGTIRWPHTPLGLYFRYAGLSLSPLFKLKYKIVVFDEVYILFHFNIILKHNGMSSTKKASSYQASRTRFCQEATMAISEAFSSIQPLTVVCSSNYTSGELTVGHSKMRNLGYTVKWQLIS